MDRAGEAVVDVPAPGVIPLDVDTWEDYEAVLATRSAEVADYRSLPNP
jgi:CTP:molybdopterin cytidylyltransferase MocA